MTDAKADAPLPSLAALLVACQAVLLAICTLLALSTSRGGGALVVLLALALAAWLAFVSARFARFCPLAAAFLTAAAIPLTGGSRSALLPYLLASGLRVGLTRGIRDLVLVSCGVSGLLLLGAALPEVTASRDYLMSGAQWVLLSFAVGLLGLWTRVQLGNGSDQYSEVRHLLEQLRRLTRHLPGGLDAGSAAQALLDSCRRVVEHDRAAVLVRPGGGGFVPLAVAGAQRVPWRDPLAAAGPLRRAWESGRPARDQRHLDTVGRRRGSTVLALPLLASHGPFGLVILEALQPDRFPPDVVEHLVRLVAEAAPQLETALLFDEVRLEASTEERDRLAREMHDGIAQELASLGYQIDDLRQRALPVDETIAALADGIRGDVTSLIADLRLSITDLRTTVRPERGLGVAMSTYLNAVCAGRDIRLHLALQETAFRLPADSEIGLLRATQVFAQEVRHTAEVSELSVELFVDPPSARLRMRCDAPLPGLRLQDVRAAAATINADVSTISGSASGPVVTLTLKGADDDGCAAGRRPLAHQAGLAASLRGD